MEPRALHEIAKLGRCTLFYDATEFRCPAVIIEVFPSIKTPLDLGRIPAEFARALHQHAQYRRRSRARVRSSA